MPVHIRWRSIRLPNLHRTAAGDSPPNLGEHSSQEIVARHCFQVKAVRVAHEVHKYISTEIQRECDVRQSTELSRFSACTRQQRRTWIRNCLDPLYRLIGGAFVLPTHGYADFGCASIRKFILEISDASSMASERNPNQGRTSARLPAPMIAVVIQPGIIIGDRRLCLFVVGACSANDRWGAELTPLGAVAMRRVPRQNRPSPRLSIARLRGRSG